MKVILVALTAACLVTACGLFGGSAHSTPTASPIVSPLAQPTGKLDAEVPMPPGFPSDVPVYPGARLTAGASFTSSGIVTWGMEWETLDSLDKVQNFYASKLSQGDWTINFKGSANGTFSAVFARKSNSRYGGIVGADGTSGVTKISLSLVSPG